MELNAKIQEAFNKQLNEELASAYLYLSMAAYFEAENFDGMAAWMKVQAKEEVDHAMKFFAYINERGGKVTLAPVAGPKTDWKSPLNAFEEAYNHECKVSAMINNLVELAAEHKDHASGVFLNWFVNEQVEEEDTALSIVEKLRMVGDQGGGLFMLDRALGQRGQG